MAHVELIAEIGSVHDGSFGNALKLIEVAAESGADAVKFQTHIPETEMVLDAPSPPYFSAEPRIDYFRRIAFSPQQWKELRAKADGCGVRFVSSPFSLEAVDLLQDIGIDAFKVASGEVTNLPMLEAIASTGLPTFLSSGMSTWEELDDAVAALKDRVALTILQCSSIYPCPPERVGLNVIGEMKDRYGLPVGFSDHTSSASAAIAAATMGATAIEKHLSFSRKMYGSDAAHSMEPGEFRTMAMSIREVEQMLDAPVDKSQVDGYREMKTIFEKSIVAGSSLEEGTTLTMEHLAFKKPGDGLTASRYREVLGRRLVRAVEVDEQIREEDLR